MPPNTTIQSQPMDRGVIYTDKHLERKKKLNNILKVVELTVEKEEQKKGK